MKYVLQLHEVQPLFTFRGGSGAKFFGGGAAALKAEKFLTKFEKKILGGVLKISLHPPGNPPMVALVYELAQIMSLLKNFISDECKGKSCTHTWAKSTLTAYMLPYKVNVMAYNNLDEDHNNIP